MSKKKAESVKEYRPSAVEQADRLPEWWRQRFSDLLRRTPAVCPGMAEQSLRTKIYRYWSGEDCASAQKCLNQIYAEMAGPELLEALVCLIELVKLAELELSECGYFLPDDYDRKAQAQKAIDLGYGHGH